MMKKKVKIILVGVGLTIFVIGCFCLPPYIKYRRALNLYNLAKDYVSQEKYDEALSICKTSSHKEQISKLIDRERLTDALQFIDDEKYDESAKLLSQIERFTYHTEDEAKKVIKAFNKVYTDDDFENTKIFLSAIKDVAADKDGVDRIEKELEVLQKFQGDWYASDNDYYTWFRIDGWEMQCFDKMLNDFMYPEKLLYDEETQSFHSASKDYTIYIENDNVYEKWVDDNGKTHIFKCEKKDIIPKINPRIGMTAEEVRNSTWGSPEDINKHTYSWGVKEQWCYYGNKYIYFEDGIVTSISE